MSLIGSIQIAIAAKEPTGDSRRRLLALPMLVTERFIELVEEQQPRALVVLAHYFALLVGFSSFWQMGNAGQREIRGIRSVVPAEWLDLMRAPLHAIGDA